MEWVIPALLLRGNFVLRSCQPFLQLHFMQKHFSKERYPAGTAWQQMNPKNTGHSTSGHAMHKHKCKQHFQQTHRHSSLLTHPLLSRNALLDLGNHFVALYADLPYAAAREHIQPRSKTKQDRKKSQRCLPCAHTSGAQQFLQ